MAKKTDEEKFLEAHQKERDVLFANEAFVIGVLQAVSGGSLFAALAQSEALLKLAGRLPFFAFLTLMAHRSDVSCARGILEASVQDVGRQSAC